MIATIIVLSVMLIIAFAYVLSILRQVRSLSSQLSDRLEGRDESSVTVDLINRDIELLASRINEATRSIKHANLMALQSEQQLLSYIADVSHDLRTPLTAIRGYQQLLGRSTLSPSQREKLSVAQKHTAELESLVRRLYEYTYLLDSRPPIDITEIDIGSLVEDSLASLSRSLDAAGIRVSFISPGPMVTLSDTQMVTRIIHNLVENAAFHGERFLQACISTHNLSVEHEHSQHPDSTNENWIVVSFTNGIALGAPIDTIHIFDRFYTADRSRSLRSTGLGLSIVNTLTKQLGGKIEADTRTGPLGDEIVISVLLPLTSRTQ